MPSAAGRSGGPADPELLDRLRRTVAELASTAAWVVFAGSLPPAAPQSWYADAAEALAGTPARVAVDTSGGPLLELADRLGSARPDVLKTNADELALLTGDDAAAIEADPLTAAASARRLVDQGAGAVLVTLGGAGAVLVTEEGAWRAGAPPVTVVSTVGAGDSSLFGYLLGDLRGEGPAERLRLAVAYGSAAAGLPGTTIPAPHQVHPELVTVQSIQATPTPMPKATPAGENRGTHA